MMKHLSRAGVIVAVVALIVVGIMPDIVRAQDDPAWVTYTTEDGVLTFEVPADWVVTDDSRNSVLLASDPAAVGQEENLGDRQMFGSIWLPAYITELLEEGFGYGTSLTPQDDLMLQAESLTTDPVYRARTYLWLDDDTLLVVAPNATGTPYEAAWIVRRVGDNETVRVSGMARHGQLVWFVDDLITLTQSITINAPIDSASAAPEGDLPALDATYVTLDEALTISYPAGWATHLFNPGTILFGSSQDAIDRLINRGKVAPESALFTLVTPPVVAALLETALTPENTPDEVLTFFIAYSNAAEAYGEIEVLTVGDYPAARAFMAQHQFQVVTYAVQLAPGQFATFDLMVDGDEFERHAPLLEAIMASAEIMGE